MQVMFGNQQGCCNSNVVRAKASLDVFAIEANLIRLVVGLNLLRFGEGEGFETTVAIATTVLDGDTQTVERAVDRCRTRAYALSMFRRIRDHQIVVFRVSAFSISVKP